MMLADILFSQVIKFILMVSGESGRGGLSVVLIASNKQSDLPGLASHTLEKLSGSNSQFQIY